ncbi:hypothetical protein PRUPE_2G182800 [Prunus persica]|uniref:BZIP domain-containing protein n=1 Tax=Prunus persica TaxID=3760 RepID=A0A251QKZ2_PRUPE|nr:hypothetical protein PRUPE_2G182800 [Prunus persica]ONI23336.1 hypothetical protein PRUPE_2G182800 [Prunus persica]
MGNDDDGKSAKSEKSSSPLTADQTNHSNQTNVHVYPDWAAMQAYYGPRVALPPYYNSAVASGHAPHPYMWGPPQPMMPPYGTPYAAMYSHGYAHPAVPLGSHGQAVPSSPSAATPLNMETPTKSSGNADRGLMKKLKRFDALAMSIGNSNVGDAEGGAEHSVSQSLGTEGSSEGSDGNTAGNERELKRERRKQSNRESARRSRLRKQAETEELARKVDALSAENVALKSEISRLTENSSTLKLENATLMDKLKNTRVGRMEEIMMNIDDKRVQPFSTENLLSRVNNSGSIARDAEKEGDMYEKNSGAKLHQLLDASPRADAVAAG